MPAEYSSANVDNNIDTYSLNLYPDDAPHDLLPITNLGQGDCLYRATSQLIFGTQEHHCEMRVRVVMEMLKNEEMYLNGKWLKKMSQPDCASTSDELQEYILATSLSDHTSNLRIEFRKEVMKTLRDGRFSSLLHVYALANVVQARLRMIYPNKPSIVVNRTMHNQLLTPISEGNNVVLNIMWTSTVQGNAIQMNWQPNHFVACVGAAGVHVQKQQPVLTQDDVTASVLQDGGRMAKPIERSLDAPVLTQYDVTASVPQDGGRMAKPIERSLDAPVLTQDDVTASVPQDGGRMAKPIERSLDAPVLTQDDVTASVPQDGGRMAKPIERSLDAPVLTQDDVTASVPQDGGRMAKPIERSLDAPVLTQDDVTASVPQDGGRMAKTIKRSLDAPVLTQDDVTASVPQDGGRMAKPIERSLDAPVLTQDDVTASVPQDGGRMAKTIKRSLDAPVLTQDDVTASVPQDGGRMAKTIKRSLDAPVLTQDDVTASVLQDGGRMAKTIKRSLDAPVLTQDDVTASVLQDGGRMAKTIKRSLDAPVLTQDDVTASVLQDGGRMAKTIKRSLDAPVLREQCPPCDFGEVFTEIRHVPATERYRMIKSLKRPSEQHRFPLHVEGKKRRCFQHKWLQKHQWLVYSHSLDGGLCLPCVLFAKTEHRGVGALVTSPLVKFKDATADFNKHSKTAYHRKAQLDLTEFNSIMEQRQCDVVQQACCGMRARIKENRLKLVSLVKTVVLCGRQNIALRGHRDDNQAMSNTDVNSGNFYALLRFRIDSGDSLLGKHFAEAPKNATYSSKTTQNELITLCGDHIRSKIIADITKAELFSILADEVTDTSNKEQMSLVIRFFDGTNIKERFVDFIECEHLDGASIASKLIGQLKYYGLDMSKLCGQGYDGAGNMSGRLKGAAAIIRAQFPNATYVHCNSHVLNLAVVNACDMQPMRNMMGTLKEVCIFFKYSPKRHAKLKRNIQERCPESSRSQLVNLCKTRWVARHDALEVFGDLYTAVVATFQDIVDEHSSWNSESVCKARTLQWAVTNFEFLISFTVCRNCLRYVLPLSISLQGRSMDILTAMTDVKHVISAIEKCQINMDNLGAEWYAQALCLSESVFAPQPEIPRIGRRQQNRANTPAATPQQYFHRTVTIPFIDHLLTEMKTRFSPMQQRAANGLSLIPSGWRKKTIDYSQLIIGSLPSAHSLTAELDCWQMKWDAKDCDPPNSVTCTLRETSPVMYPNVYTMLKLCATLPVTSCECERSFSMIKQLKTHIRSTMGQERLSGLALMNIHRDIPIAADDIVDNFARSHPRRMELVNVMND